jgi:hypothetical protein
MLVIANEAKDLLGVPRKILDSVTLSGHVVRRDARHYMSSPRKMVHLVDINWTRITQGTEILATSHKVGMDCFGKGNVVYVNSRVLISELEELGLVRPRCHGIAAYSLHL